MHRITITHSVLDDLRVGRPTEYQGDTLAAMIRGRVTELGAEHEYADLFSTSDPDDALIESLLASEKLRRDVFDAPHVMISHVV